MARSLSSQGLAPARMVALKSRTCSSFGTRLHYSGFVEGTEWYLPLRKSNLSNTGSNPLFPRIRCSVRSNREICLVKGRHTTRQSGRPTPSIQSPGGDDAVPVRLWPFTTCPGNRTGMKLHAQVAIYRLVGLACQARTPLPIALFLCVPPHLCASASKLLPVQVAVRLHRYFSKIDRPYGPKNRSARAPCRRRSRIIRGQRTGDKGQQPKRESWRGENRC